MPVKQKDFIIPFTWEERRCQLFDKIVFIPEYFDRHDLWTFPDLFEREAPVYVEYCSGNGSWVLQKAQEEPHVNWIAVERKFERVRKIWTKRQNLGIQNLVIVFGEALKFSRFYLPASTVDQIYINFPDPWPKKKHAKNRLIQDPFVLQMQRIAKRGAKAIIVTDDPVYSEQISSEMRNEERWTSLFPEPYYSNDWDGYGTSYFDALWREQGRTIRYHCFTNAKEE